MKKLGVVDRTRADKPWPKFMDYVFEANMIDGTIRFMAGILIFVAIGGTIFWHLLS